MALTPELPDLTAPEERFNRLKMQAASVLEYLYYHEQFITGRQEIKHLIRLGESYSLEFKSTLRQNLKSGKKDPQIEHACLKTMAAFLNSNGGVLLIGVRDDGEILGVEADGFANQDIYAQHFWNLVKASMGVDHTPMIQAGFESVDDKTVFRVDCVKSPRPVFLKQKGFDEEFFIRVGPSSAKLGIMEALQYIGQRFESHE
jgi:predicted HTH transcriptional regulator